ncbi:MAG: hypothetical protein ABSG71_03165 [Thermodesulfobacteriota bacterium]|jgi:hypothetical protein
MKRMITFLMVSFFVLSFNGFVFAKDEPTGDLSTPEVVGDVLWVRPLGFMNIGLGALFYVISLPVTVPLKKADEAKEFLITYPYDYYFKRPLREM